jgi:hypothetical protein
VDSSPDRDSAAAPHGDGVNDDVWRRLCEIVSAANRGDAKAHVLAFTTWPSELPLASQQRAGAYLLYLLYRQTKVILGRTPNPQDLHELAAGAYPRFHEVLIADEVQLEETFRTAFEFPPLRAPLSPAEFAVFSSVALGVLLTDPAAELEAMRPGMAAWLRRNQERFRAEGLLDDPSGAEHP